MVHDYGILSLIPEHIDVLALLNLIRHIVDSGLNLLYLVLVLILTLGRLILLLIGLNDLAAVLLDTILQGQVFPVNILKQNDFLHLVAELLVFQAAELDERADIVPIFLVVLSLRLAHSGKLICNLLGNVIGNLIDEPVVLERAS